MPERITNEQREAIVRQAVSTRDAMLKGAPIESYSPEDQAFYRFWYGHMQDDLMQPPLAGIDHTTARYIWDAALASAPAGAGWARKLWLWKNFVDGKPEYWAFDNPYPINLEDGDPQTLGEPCGYAIFKPSRQGRADVSEEQVLRAIRRASHADLPSRPKGWSDAQYIAVLEDVAQKMRRDLQRLTRIEALARGEE